MLQTRRKLPKYWDVPADQQPGLAWAQWLMWLPVEAVAGVAERLRFDGELRQVCVAAADLRQQRTRLARLKPSALVAHLQHVPLAAVAALWSAAEPALAAQLARYGQRLRRVQPRSDGYTLRRRGLAPGPVYAQLLWRLRAAWLDGEVRTARGEERLLESLLREAER